MKKFISVISAFAVYFSFAGFASTGEVTKNASCCESCHNASSAVEILMGIDNLVTGEMTLSRPNGSDFDVLKKYYKDVNIRYYLEAKDREMTEQQAFSELNRYNSGSNFTFVIKDKNGNLVGALILTSLPNYVNIAYWIIPEFRGHSYAAKACETIIREIHKKDSSIVFLIKLNAENTPSKNVVKKLKTALVDTKENQEAIALNKMHYELKKSDPINLIYRISPTKNNGKFLFNIFKNGRKTYSGLCNKEQVLDFTYKKIFDRNELEIVKLEHFIRLVH